MPTRQVMGFLKKPSLVFKSPSSLNSNSKLRPTVATISASSISATFLPTHALGPYENGMKAPFCFSVKFSGSQRSGLKRLGLKAGLLDGFQIEGRWWMV